MLYAIDINCKPNERKIMCSVCTGTAHILPPLINVNIIASTDQLVLLLTTIVDVKLYYDIIAAQRMRTQQMFNDFILSSIMDVWSSKKKKILLLLWTSFWFWNFLGEFWHSYPIERKILQQKTSFQFDFNIFSFMGPNQPWHKKNSRLAKISHNTIRECPSLFSF